MSNMKMTISAICNGETLTTISNDTHTWYIDEPEAFGGEDKAPSPVHTLLGAIAGCIIASGYMLQKSINLIWEIWK